MSQVSVQGPSGPSCFQISSDGILPTFLWTASFARAYTLFRFQVLIQFQLPWCLWQLYLVNQQSFSNFLIYCLLLLGIFPIFLNIVLFFSFYSTIKAKLYSMCTKLWEIVHYCAFLLPYGFADGVISILI